MKKEHAVKVADYLAGHSLDGTLPALRPYLKPGASVLDVGCGPGSITLDVARVVDPGRVVGIDAIKVMIGRASEDAKRQKQSNVTFKQSDAHSLDFPDNTFDVAYSFELFQYLIDPGTTLKEQKRVTKTGGWVVAAGMDQGFSIRHPPCPAYEDVIEARLRYADYLRVRFKPGDEIPGFFSGFSDPYAGRKCVEWFTKAGLGDLRIEVIPATAFPIEYHGIDGFESKPLLRRVNLDGLRGEYFKSMVEGGFLD